MLRKSLLFGIAGTLVYCGLVAAVALVAGKPLADFASPTDFVGQLVLVPLLPGLLPGLLIAGKLSLGTQDPSGFLGALLLAPFVNSVWVYLWLRRRARQQSDCCS